MEEKHLNEKESLELISRMIRNTQNKLEVNAGIPMLVWGYVTVVVTVAVGVLLRCTGHDYWHFLWFAIPALGWPLAVLFTHKTPKSISTFVDRVIGYVWLVLGIGCFIFSVVSFFTHFPVLAVVLLLVGSGSVISGMITQFAVLTVGGVVSMALSVLLVFMPQSLIYVLPVFALAFVFMSIIPGHILQAKAKKANREVENV